MKSIHTDRYDHFLKEIIAARREAGVTQQDLAERLGRPQSYVSKYERGERRLDVIEFLEIANILKFDPCELLSEIETSDAAFKRGSDK